MRREKTKKVIQGQFVKMAEQRSQYTGMGYSETGTRPGSQLAAGNQSSLLHLKKGFSPRNAKPGEILSARLVFRRVPCPNVGKGAPVPVAHVYFGKPRMLPTGKTEPFAHGRGSIPCPGKRTGPDSLKIHHAKGIRQNARLFPSLFGQGNIGPTDAMPLSTKGMPMPNQHDHRSTSRASESRGTSARFSNSDRTRRARSRRA